MLWDASMFHPSSSSFPGFAMDHGSNNDHHDSNNNHSNNHEPTDVAHIHPSTTDQPEMINPTIGVDQGVQEVGVGSSGAGNIAGNGNDNGNTVIVTTKKRILQPRDRSQDRYHRPNSPSR